MAITDISLRPTAGHSAGAPAAADSAGSTRLPLVAALYLLSVVLPIGFNAGPLAMTNLRLLLLLVTVPLMVNIVIGKYGKVYITDWLFMLYIGWSTVSLAVNNPQMVVQQAGSTGIEFLGGYAVGRAYIRTPGQFLALCRWLIVLVLCTTPFSILEALDGRPLIVETIRKIPGLTSVAPVYIEGRMGLERVQSVFAHPIHYGLFCSVAFSMTFVALQDRLHVTKRFVLAGTIMFSGFLALSSGALLAMLLQLGLIAWYTVFEKIRWRWWLLVGMFALAYVVIDLLSNRTPLRVFMSYATFSAHNAYWRGIIFEWGMKNVWANPIFGLGLRDWVRPSFMYSGSMDNFWLVVAVRHGIPGWILLVSGYAYVIYRVMRRTFDGDRTLLLIRRAWVFTFLGLTFTLCTVHVWTNIYSFVFFMYAAGVWLIAAQPEAATAAAPAEAETGRRAGPVLARKHEGTGYSRSPEQGAAPQATGRAPAAVYSRSAIPAAPARPAAAEARGEAQRYSRFGPRQRRDADET